MLFSIGLFHNFVYWKQYKFYIMCLLDFYLKGPLLKTSDKLDKVFCLVLTGLLKTYDIIYNYLWVNFFHLYKFLFNPSARSFSFSCCGAQGNQKIKI